MSARLIRGFRSFLEFSNWLDPLKDGSKGRPDPPACEDVFATGRQSGSKQGAFVPQTLIGSGHGLRAGTPSEDAGLARANVPASTAAEKNGVPPPRHPEGHRENSDVSRQVGYCP